MAESPPFTASVLTFGKVKSLRSSGPTGAEVDTPADHGGLVYPEREVFFHDHVVSEKTLKDKSFLRFFRERVGYVFQDSDVQLFCPTVLDELLTGPCNRSPRERGHRKNPSSCGESRSKA